MMSLVVALGLVAIGIFIGSVINSAEWRKSYVAQTANLAAVRADRKRLRAERDHYRKMWTASEDKRQITERSLKRCRDQAMSQAKARHSLEVVVEAQRVQIENLEASR